MQLQSYRQGLIQRRMPPPTGTPHPVRSYTTHLVGLVKSCHETEIMKGPMLYKGDTIEVLGTEGGKPRKTTIPVPPHEPISKPEASGAQPTKAADESVDAAAADNEKIGLENVAVNQVPNGETQPAAA